MSIQYRHGPLKNQFKKAWDTVRGKSRGARVNWLRPIGGNLAQMKQVVEQTLSQGNDYVEFMLHSSEFMPDGSPTFKNDADIDRLYDDLEQLFSWLQVRTQGMTLTEYALKKKRHSEPSPIHTSSRFTGFKSQPRKKRVDFGIAHLPKLFRFAMALTKACC